MDTKHIDEHSATQPYAKGFCWFGIKGYKTNPSQKFCGKLATAQEVSRKKDFNIEIPAVKMYVCSEHVKYLIRNGYNVNSTTMP